MCLIGVQQPNHWQSCDVIAPILSCFRHLQRQCPMLRQVPSSVSLASANLRSVALILAILCLVTYGGADNACFQKCPCQCTEVSSTTCTLKIGYIVQTGKGHLIKGAVPIAEEHLNTSSKLPSGYTLIFEESNINDTSSSEAIQYMTSWRDRGFVGFIGPDELCNAEALVASAWNLPMISYKCSDKRTSNTKYYSTFARTNPPSIKVAKFVITLLKFYKWYHFLIIVEESPQYLQIKDALVELAARENKMNLIMSRSIQYYTKNGSKTDKDVKVAIDETVKETRIYVFIGEDQSLIDFVRAMYNKKYLQNGEYAIIAIDDEIYNATKRYQYILKPQNHELHNKTIEEIDPAYIEPFRAVLKVTPYATNNTIYHNFLEKMKQRMAEENTPRSILSNLQIPVYAAYMYDAIMVYVQALNKTIQKNIDIADGKAILENIRGITYESIQGYDVRIDDSGDSEGNYTVLSLLKDGNRYTGMRPVGWFTPDANYTLTYIEEKSIDWFGGEPPSDVPKCGFKNENCNNDVNWIVVAIGVVSSVVIIVVLGLIARHYRYEHLLACLLWKIDGKDLHIISDTIILDDEKKEITNLASLPQGLVLENLPSFPNTKIGIYRGTLFAVRLVNKKNVDLTRSIRKELKDMRDVRHENLVPFVGACIEPHVCIVTAYCTRGSLEDVLQNNDLALDRIFIASLIADLIKGMTYLHESVIVSHGNLKSSNCLVDSRWVLQISDYGLHEFKGSQEIRTSSHSNFYKRLLWRAPELLRTTSPPARGTQKGDVYSFAIILHEIMKRAGPWGNLPYSYKEIIDRVAYPAQYADHVFRPSVAGLICHDSIINCMRECWAEDPEFRPDFRSIHIKLKEFQTGIKPNIFDNMMAIMEKHASNLESLVADRTHQLTEEKKKTDSLLHRMLPKSVADQLKKGEQVAPESFDAVTIYFSDIVGFTALSAVSTPFQVVNLLNELYTRFDHIIESYDAYKVETIGDAYMVVSGLPIRNGDRHAGEIAKIALHLLEAIKNFEISHRKGERLKLRIGIHSGPCAAGVVGLKMPRYCLFGDTVNTASRMESTGEPLKIHVSEACKKILDRLGGFRLKERGLIQIKGKGEMRTYWLVEMDNEERNTEPLPINETSTLSPFHSPSLAQRVEPRKISTSLPKIVENHESSDGEFGCDTSLDFSDITPLSSLPGSPNLSSTRWLLSDFNMNPTPNGYASRPSNHRRHNGRHNNTRNNNYVSCLNVFQEYKNSFLKELKRNGHSVSVNRYRSAPTINENFV